MVAGIDSFREWFKGCEGQYAIIGGTACDILMTEVGLDFRATKDIDLVLIVEAVDVNFGKKFWEYVKQAGYEHRNRSSGVSQFYRFSHPSSNKYPSMIELFTRKIDSNEPPRGKPRGIRPSLYFDFGYTSPKSSSSCPSYNFLYSSTSFPLFLIYFSIVSLLAYIPTVFA